jgi:hypothetical protein
VLTNRIPGQSLDVFTIDTERQWYILVVYKSVLNKILAYQAWKTILKVLISYEW